jgi:NAD(P) transhydrogenase
MKEFDLIVLGSGPSGRRAAIQAAKLGRSVLIVDNRARVGGVSVHTGTIPSKTLRETVLNLSGWRERGFYGRSYRVKKEICGADLAERLGMTLNHEVDVLDHQFARNGVSVLHGSARFLDTQHISIRDDSSETPHEIIVMGKKIVIAVGSKPYRPKGVPFDGFAVLDSDDFIASPRVPKSLTVIGAGVIGMEYATIFSALDVPVAIVEPRETILDFIDQEVVASLIYQLRDRGVGIHLGTKAETILATPGHGVTCTLTDGRKIRSDMLLYAAGRIGATDQLDLKNCGLGVDHRGRLSVDPISFQTRTPNIYATGDVIGFPSLASTSMEQGRIAACHAFGAPLPSSHQHFPLGIYSVPEISSVGLTAADAAAQGIACEFGVARIRETSRGHIMGISSGMLKIVVALKSRRLLGVHIIGEGATELIHIGQAVINLGGTIDYFIENSFNYPTLAEAYKIAALDAWNRLDCAADSYKMKAKIKRLAA